VEDLLVLAQAGTSLPFKPVRGGGKKNKEYRREEKQKLLVACR
jgi:hypothetical protein